MKTNFEQFTFLVFCTVGLLGLSVGCDGTTASPDGAIASPDGGPPGAEGAAFLELCAQTETYCANLYACAPAGRLDLEQSLFGHHDVAGCVIAMDASVGAACRVWAASIDAGRLSADVDALTRCADVRNGGTCEDYFATETSPECDGTPFLTGQVESGGECASDLECATTGDVCSGGRGALGVCAPLPGVGEPCFSGDRCAETLSCDAGTCSVGGECENDLDCSGGWCDQPGNDWAAPSGPGVCTPFRHLGEECDDYHSCESPLYCDNNNGYEPSGVRAPGNCAARRPTGEPCDEPIDCESATCLESNVCG